MVSNQDLTLNDGASYEQLVDERSRLAYLESVAEKEIATAEAEGSKIVGQVLEEDKRVPTTSSNDAAYTPADPGSAQKELAAEVIGQVSPGVQVFQAGTAVLGESRINDSNAADVAKGKKAGLVSADAKSIQDIAKQMKQPAMSGANYGVKDGNVGFAEVSKLTKDMPRANAKSQIQLQQVQGTLQNVVKNSYGIKAANQEAVAEIDHKLRTQPNAAASPSVMGMGGPAMAYNIKGPTHMSDEETTVV